MPRAVGDPRSIQELERALDRAATDMDRIANQLKAKLRSTDWEDPVMRKFEGNLNDLVKHVGRFKDEAKEAGVYLRRKVQQLNDYLGT